MTNVLLLGIDDGGSNADAIVIVAINRDSETAAMLSIPRDTYLYIPEVGHMGRINSAFAGGVERVKQTILYNFGIPIHYYAQIDFNGFKQAVDAMGGVDVAVSCQLRDWRLESPDLDPDVEENWEMFTVPPGIHHMDGNFALWYTRSRKSTSDFDRGRRQQQLLRSMLNQGVDLNLLAQAPELWATYRDTVETDMDIGRMLQLATMAPAVRENGIQHLYLVGGTHLQGFLTEEGAQVQLPVWEELLDKISKLALPPALNRATRPVITVEIVDGNDNPEMVLLAAENLAWYGFEPVFSDSRSPIQETTTIQYYGQNFKGSFDWIMGWILDRRLSTFELVPDTEYEYDYRVVLGNDYDPCRPGQLLFETYSLDQ